MRKSLPLLAAAMLGMAAGAPAAVTFDPANPSTVNLGNGSFSGNNQGYEFVETRVGFWFTSSPDTHFTLSNITLSGDGITGSFLFWDVTTFGNDVGFFTQFRNLSFNVTGVNWDNTSVSFDLPGGNVISQGTEFTVSVEYYAGNGYEMDSGFSGPITAVPEPGTWAAAALLVGGAAYVRWRKRKKA